MKNYRNVFFFQAMLYFILIVLLFVVFGIMMLGCTTTSEVYEPMYLTGSLYVENDTIVGVDSLKYWTR